MAVLMQVPAADGSVLIVEADRGDVRGELVMAAAPGQTAAKAAQTLSDSLGQLQPLLNAVKNQLAASMPDSFTVEFGVKFGGETGIIVAKGTAEVNLKITLAWNKETPTSG
jgi:Trypsin-co-occurring domain 1